MAAHVNIPHFHPPLCAAAHRELLCDFAVSLPPLQFEQWMTARWATERRYYVVEITQNLFGSWQLTHSSGALHSHRGHSLTIPSADYTHALQLFRQVEKRRKVHVSVRILSP